MNIWFHMLSDAPATLQRLIARANRISLPRGAAPNGGDRGTALHAAMQCPPGADEGDALSSILSWFFRSRFSIVYSRIRQ